MGNKVGIDETVPASPVEATTSKVSEKEKVNAPPFPQRKFQDYEKVVLTEKVSAVLLRKLPPKLKDPGSFAIPCRIGDQLFDRALLDLGATIEESPMSLHLPIILGRSFMRTADTKICVKKGIVSMKVNGEKIEFKVFDALKPPQDNLDCFNIRMLQNAVEEVFQGFIR
ncbi:uncharacterized protein LOC133860342 [Alnus glutinosa]|uniref:uncharacterized protein LOC133860342 n=1 Tax=Alnus glutinosa TaxID=3517 RepID=UPI002D764E6F|nr:uncharacterized protein LOC133860342 [Alnus glutinosa]